MRIGLIQGNGQDLVGGGSIQLAYNIWANKQKDIELINFLQSDKNEKINKETIMGRELTNIVKFSTKEKDYSEFDEIDKVIILTYPFKQSKEIDKQNYKWYKGLLDKLNKENKFIGVICYDYLKDVVLNNIGAVYPDLYYNSTKIWVNNENNPLIEHLTNNTSKDISNKFYITCPQFINEVKKNWYKESDKFMSQLYYQGRALDWKGWKELLPLKNKLEKNGLNVNVAFNGINLSSNEIYRTLLDTNTHSASIDSSVFGNKKFFNSLYENGFSKTINHGINIYGYYDPKTADELTAQAGFALYYTNLDPSSNFFPEYAFMDAVLNGTVVILPDWYFDSSIYPSEAPNIIKESPEEAGFLIWNSKNPDMDIELANKIKELQFDFDLYNRYRTRALQYMIRHHGANKQIRKFLEE